MLRFPCVSPGALRLFLIAAVSIAVARTDSAAVSFYTHRLDDAKAVYLERPAFAVHADGVGDDSDALQQAINRVQETVGMGVLFIPEGRYRLTRTIHVWKGVRLVGFGARRPVFALGPNTPGYQEGDDRYMIHFVSDRPAQGQPVRDANPGTFYSGISNIDIEIGPGNPAAVGVRAHFAQHCHLAHMEFRIGEGRAGVEEVGNEAEDLHFIGGDFGITMHKPSPSWPFALLDATFEGQRVAAIETEEGGLTLIRPRFRNVPTAILVRPDRAEELWLQDAVLENITGPAIVISDEGSARTMINAQNVACDGVPVFARFRTSGREVRAPGPRYVVRQFSHGLHLDHPGAVPEIRTTTDFTPVATLPPPVPSDVPDLPPRDTWVNVRTLGLVGDGVTDETEALRRAIAAHRTLYFPTGRYRVTDTITLRPESVLIGLTPTGTQILITDDTPAFGPVAMPVPGVELPPAGTREFPAPFHPSGPPKALVESASGGAAILTGLGLDTGGRNPRAVALKWMAGEHSLVNDVRFLGGHGTYHADGKPLAIYNSNRTADPDPRRRWDSQYWSLWVTAGGGGTFKGLWTPSPYAMAGMYVSDTTTPGRVYAMSSEHHVRHEVILRRVANWGLFALQMEEERGESGHALPLEITDSHDITIANLYLYRVDMDTPFATGVVVDRSHDIHLRGVHAYSPGKLTFDNTVRDATTGIDVRSREIAWLRFPADRPAAPTRRPPEAVLAPGAQIERLTGGFNAIDSLVVDAAGTAYFVDPRWQRIYAWAHEARLLSVVTDAPLHPAGLALDASGHLLVVTKSGSVLSLRPGQADTTTTVLAPQAAAPRGKAVAWLPVSRWRDSHDWIAATTRREPLHYVAEDASMFVPAPASFATLGVSGIPWWSRGTVDLARAYMLAPAVPARPFYAADEFGQKTWRFTVQPDGTLTDPQLFAEEGEAGVAVDAHGNVFVCAGQVFVYASSGKLLGVIDVPERPAALGFAGADRHTLLIAARSSLYAIRLQ
ncbi:MAG: SMP-30/gluconolactonase/LRE family protein [Opitutaceae bacterium]|nr:SMP-30/gluconolactonase/LRE family protein [Opitutaceae bacterium]